MPEFVDDSRREVEDVADAVVVRAVAATQTRRPLLRLARLVQDDVSVDDVRHHHPDHFRLVLAALRARRLLGSRLQHEVDDGSSLGGNRK